jgi:hypothetical protein
MVVMEEWGKYATCKAEDNIMKWEGKKERRTGYGSGQEKAGRSGARLLRNQTIPVFTS